jgi:hypothetical protein
MATRPRPPSHHADPAPAVLAAASLLALCSLAVLGCGRAAQPAAQPGAETPTSTAASPESESASETLEQAEAELEQARLQLAELGVRLSAPPVAPAAQAPAAGAPSPTAQAQKKAEPKEKREAAEAAPSPPRVSRAPSRAEESLGATADEGSARDENPCLNACKAYASLVRAKNAVCRLDAPNGARCSRAEGIVRDATPQVQSCQCAP